MTTDDNRPQGAGGYSARGPYNADTEDFSGFGRPSPGVSEASRFDTPGYTGATSVMPGSAPSYDTFPDDDDKFDSDPYDGGSASTTSSGGSYDDDSFDDGFGARLADDPRRTARWHGGLDVGLLVLRLALGGLFVVHGLDKLFGWFTDMGMGNTEQLLVGFDFTEPKILAWVLAVSETAGGLLLVLGLFTPAAAAAVLGVMATVVVLKSDWNLFLGDVELELMFGAAAFALLFTGPGRISIDRHTHWFRKAPLYGIVFLVLAIAATVVTLVVFR